jgi:hypothetical protein
MTFDAEFSFEVTETKGLKLSGSYYSDSWNPLAGAYISKVEEYDSYMFSNAQKDAIGEFFDALEVENLVPKIKKMWLMGFSVDAGLRDVMNPTETEEWYKVPDDPFGQGYLDLDGDGCITGVATMAELGLAKNNAGTFISITDARDEVNMTYVQATQVPSDNSRIFELNQRNGGSYEPHFRSMTNFLNFEEGHRDGVFLASRSGVAIAPTLTNTCFLTQVSGERATTTTIGSPALPSTSPPLSGFTLFGGVGGWPTVTGKVSSVGITLGLGETESETLAGLIYDLCVGVGHTDLTGVNV